MPSNYLNQNGQRDRQLHMTNGTNELNGINGAHGVNNSMDVTMTTESYASSNNANTFLTAETFPNGNTPSSNSNIKGESTPLMPNKSVPVGMMNGNESALSSINCDDCNMSLFIIISILAGI
jgi:hypothetical protein